MFIDAFYFQIFQNNNLNIYINNGKLKLSLIVVILEKGDFIMKKRNLLFVLALMAALIAVPAYAYGPAFNDPYSGETGVPLTVHVDGKYVSTDVDPYISNGRTYLPLRAAAESMGAAVVWDNNTRSATVTKDGTVIRCTVGSTAFSVNGVTKYNDAAPQIVAGRTMLPIRPIAEALGGTLSWDGTTASVTIDTPATDLAAPTLPSDIPSEVRWLVEKYYVPADGNGNGSWQCIVPANQVRYALRYTNNYLFVSEMADGRKNAVMVGYINTGSPSIGVDSMEVVTTSGKLQLKDTWSPHYWHGYGINSSSMYLLVNYDYSGDNLHLSSCTLKNSVSSPGWKDETNTLNADFVPFGSSESEKPVDPDNPFPGLAYERYPGDENAPDWMVAIDVVKADSPEAKAYYNGDESGAFTVYVTKPEDMPSSQWEELKAYYRDKERPSALWPDGEDWNFINTPLASSYPPVYQYKDSTDLTTNFVQKSYDENIKLLYKNMVNNNPNAGNIINYVPNVPNALRYEPYPGDENAPDWMVHFIVEVDFSYWRDVYVTKPDKMSNAQWESMKEYYKNREKPDTYPSQAAVGTYFPAGVNNVQSSMDSYLMGLYSTQLQEMAQKDMSVGTLELSTIEQAVADGINEKRRAAGLKEFVVSPLLSEGASIRAKESLINYSHTRPDGSDYESIVYDLGMGEYMDVISYSGYPINHVILTETIWKTGQSYSAQEVVEQLWDGDSQALHTDLYGYMGVAAYKTSSGETAWTLLYGRTQ